MSRINMEQRFINPCGIYRYELFSTYQLGFVKVVIKRGFM